MLSGPFLNTFSYKLDTFSKQCLLIVCCAPILYAGFAFGSGFRINVHVYIGRSIRGTGVLMTKTSSVPRLTKFTGSAHVLYCFLFLKYLSEEKGELDVLIKLFSCFYVRVFVSSRHGLVRDMGL